MQSDALSDKVGKVVKPIGVIDVPHLRFFSSQ